MAVSNAQAAKINKMNRASQDITLGTLLQTLETAQSSADTSASAISTLESEMTAAEIQLDTSASAITVLQGQVITTGSIAVTTVHTNASVVTIATGLGSITGWQLSTYGAAGSPLGDPYVSNSSGSLLVMATDAVYGVSGSFALTATDIYNWIAW